MKEEHRDGVSSEYCKIRHLRYGRRYFPKINAASNIKGYLQSTGSTLPWFTARLVYVAIRAEQLPLRRSVYSGVLGSSCSVLCPSENNTQFGPTMMAVIQDMTPYILVKYYQSVENVSSRLLRNAGWFLPSPRRYIPEYSNVIVTAVINSSISHIVL